MYTIQISFMSSHQCHEYHGNTYSVPLQQGIMEHHHPRMSSITVVNKVTFNIHGTVHVHVHVCKQMYANDKQEVICTNEDHMIVQFHILTYSIHFSLPNISLIILFTLFLMFTSIP